MVEFKSIHADRFKRFLEVVSSELSDQENLFITPLTDVFPIADESDIEITNLVAEDSTIEEITTEKFGVDHKTGPENFDQKTEEISDDTSIAEIAHEDEIFESSTFETIQQDDDSVSEVEKETEQILEEFTTEFTGEEIEENVTEVESISTTEIGETVQADELVESEEELTEVREIEDTETVEEIVTAESTTDETLVKEPQAEEVIDEFSEEAEISFEDISEQEIKIDVGEVETSEESVYKTIEDTSEITETDSDIIRKESTVEEFVKEETTEDEGSEEVTDDEDLDDSDEEPEIEIFDAEFEQEVSFDVDEKEEPSIEEEKIENEEIIEETATVSMVVEEAIDEVVETEVQAPITEGNFYLNIQTGNFFAALDWSGKSTANLNEYIPKGGFSSEQDDSAIAVGRPTGAISTDPLQVFKSGEFFSKIPWDGKSEFEGLEDIAASIHIDPSQFTGVGGDSDRGNILNVGLETAVRTSELIAAGGENGNQAALQQASDYFKNLPWNKS